ncbi:hypothetical protein H4R18_002107 [Coemansia javaensis]|uniref:WD40 repeat-like protein n=1 Tax=Coemansia javaensis TaxID=2761396 RepID=A0A9W8LJ94_9FUNG|nr:hypothetical protein H4R18_002107 [Coemansia javaensis]
MGLGDKLSQFIPKDFGKKKKKEQPEPKDVSVAAAAADAEHKPEGSADAPVPEDTVATETTTAAEATKPPTSTGDRDELPDSQQAVMSGHKKAVSTIAWDATGDTLASGEHGANMAMWDFGSMDRTFQAFRTVVPYEGQQIHAARFSPDGALLACATGDPRAKLFAPDGRAVGEFKRGDMYVMDMRRTTGHVAALTSLDWSPLGGRLVTAGADSTLRLWDCERLHAQEHVIVAKTKTRGARVAVTACAYSGDGRTIASAQQDGHLSLWPAAGPFVRPAQHVLAHTPGAEVSAAAFVPGAGFHLVSRGERTVKLWDVRRMAKPLAVCEGLPSAGPEAGVAFSPSGRTLLVGAASGTHILPASATLAVLSTADMTERRRVQLGQQQQQRAGDVLSISWHPRLDQVAVGLTSGDIVLLYDPERGGMRGAARCARRQPRRSDGAVGSAGAGPIITPHALPLFRDERPAAGKRRRPHDGPARSQAPQMPVVQGHGRGGAIGVNETQHIMKSLIKDTIRDEDPREALLRYAAVAESDPKFIAPSYAKTQAEPVFDDSAAADVPEMKRRK